MITTVTLANAPHHATRLHARPPSGMEPLSSGGGALSPDRPGRAAVAPVEEARGAARARTGQPDPGAAGLPPAVHRAALSVDPAGMARGGAAAPDLLALVCALRAYRTSVAVRPVASAPGHTVEDGHARLSIRA